MNEEILADFFECFKPFANYVIARPQAVAIRYPLNETNPEGI